MRPEQRVEAAVQRWGEPAVVRWCTELLRGEELADDRFALAATLGNLSDPEWLFGGKPPGHAYWARVWAARALRYSWEPTAAPVVLAALADEQWRVREQAAKVIGDREIGTAADRLVDLGGDPVPRVRAAAARALAEVGEGEHADVLHRLAEDPEPLVARAAGTALRRMSRRLDRDLA